MMINNLIYFIYTNKLSGVGVVLGSVCSCFCEFFWILLETDSIAFLAHNLFTGWILFEYSSPFLLFTGIVRGVVQLFSLSFSLSVCMCLCAVYLQLTNF